MSQLNIIEEKLVSLDGAKVSIVLAVASAKGGVGKTTVAVNLACGLANRGFKVFLADLDPNISSSVWLLITDEAQTRAEEFNIGYLLLKPKSDIKNFIQQIEPGNFYSQSSGGTLDFLPGGSNTSSVENRLTAESGSETRLQRVLEQIRRSYDFIILDCPGKLDGKLTINAFTASTHYIVPIIPEFLPMASSVITDSRMEDIKENCNPNIKFLGLILNKYKGRLTKTKRTLEQLSEQFQAKNLFQVKIPDRTDYANNPADGASYLYIKKGDSQKIMNDLIDELLERLKD